MPVVTAGLWSSGDGAMTLTTTCGSETCAYARNVFLRDFFSVSVAIGFPVVMRLLGESMGGVNQAGCSCFRGFTRCSGRLGFQ